MRKVFLIIFAWAILVLSPTLSQANLFVKNDLETNLLHTQYLKDSLLKYHVMPLWNPFINQGIPIASDPLNNLNFPGVTPIFLLFDFNTGVKIIYVLCLTLAGLLTYLLCRNFKINYWTGLMLGLTYMAGGAFVGRIMAGHFEKVLSYPILPLFLLSLVRKRPVWIGLSLTLLLFSADMYNFYYGVAIFTVLMVLNIKQIKTYISSALIFIYLSAVKLIPMLLIFGRIDKIADPFSGSQNLISFIYHLFTPLSFLFKYLHVWSLVPTNFAWWEKTGFIGPIFLFTTIMYILGLRKTAIPKVLIITILVLCFFATPAWHLNPLYWAITAFPALGLFHVPTRVFALLALPILVIGGLVLNKFKSNLFKILLLINLLSVLMFSIYVQTHKAFPVHDNLPTSFMLAGFDSIPNQLQTVHNQQKIISNSYGLLLKNSPASFWQQAVVTHTKNTDLNISNYIQSNVPIKNFQIKPNQIIINFEKPLTSDQIITVYESYFPGWNSLPGRFLTTKVPSGSSNFSFVFTSPLYYLGLSISFVAFGVLKKYV